MGGGLRSASLEGERCGEYVRGGRDELESRPTCPVTAQRAGNASDTVSYTHLVDAETTLCCEDTAPPASAPKRSSAANAVTFTRRATVSRPKNPARSSIANT